MTIPRCPGKNSWPELVGFQGEVAAQVIKSENHLVKAAIIVKKGSLVTMDFRCDRVWVWINEHGIVTETPLIG